MIILVLMVITLMHYDVECYRFEDGYSEIWYQIPVSHIFSLEELSSATKDSISKKYYYRVKIYDMVKQDSSFFEGTKGKFIHIKQKDDYFIDFIPVYLYPGNFSYRLTIGSLGERLAFEGKIDINEDTLLLSLSDIILGRKTKGNFICHGYPFTPAIAGIFPNSNILFSYVEIYNLLPDSLYYKIQYSIIDSLGKVVLEDHRQYQKFNYSQMDTFTVKLTDLIDGIYTFAIDIFDPSSNSSISCSKRFRIISLSDETAEMKFYKEIKYLVSNEEYKKFCLLSEVEKKAYLKKFWAKRDYRQFEKRLIEADTRFSTSFNRGRDTPQGRLYILNGSPDEIRKYGLEAIRTPDKYRDGEFERAQEIWIYEAKEIEVLFRDNNGDGIYELIRTQALGHQDIKNYFKTHRELEGYFR